MEATEIKKVFRKRILFFFIVSLTSVFPAVALYLDIVVLGHGMPEVSVTEISQELCVLIAVLSAFYCSKQGDKGFYELVVGFFLVVLIREFDMFLDDISHGFWKYPAFLVFLFSVYRAYLFRKGFLHSMSRFMASNPGTIVILGLITVIFFSRVFGTSNLWSPLMGEHFLPIYKDAIQEGVELYGYLLIMVGSLLNLSSSARESDRA